MSHDRHSLRWPEAAPAKAFWRLSEQTVFLNHGSFGACPRVVLEAQQAWRDEMESAPLQFLWRRHAERLDPARRTVAAFVGSAPEDLVFVSNTTSGVNAVVRSLEFQPGDEILTTDQDYNACHNVLVEVARRSGARVVTVEVPLPVESPEAVVEAVLAAVTARTRLALLDHITSNGAMIFPIRELVSALDRRGVDTLVDGAHAPGMLPLDLENLGAAYYTGNLHKWACAPKGAAFLRVRADRQNGIQPPVISQGNNQPRTGYNAFQSRFDWAGTQDFTSCLAAATAIQWLGDSLPGGWPAVYEHHRTLVTGARRMFCERFGLKAPCPETMIGAMATLPLPGRLGEPEGNAVPDPLYAVWYDEFGLEMPVMRMAGRRWFRISGHLHNSPDEFRYAADVLEVLTRRAGS